MTIAPEKAVAALPALLRRRREERLPDPAKRREIRDSAGLTREEMAAAMRAEGHNITLKSIEGWERPRASGGWEPRRDRAIAYRRLLERIQAEVASWACETQE